MKVSYKKLWKLLIDKDMKKKGSLCEGRYQPSIGYQDGPKRFCHHRGLGKNLRCPGLSDRRCDGNHPRGEK